MRSVFVYSSFRIILLRKMGFVIGKNVYIGDNFFLSDRSIDKNHIIIGDRAEIGANCTLITTSGPAFSKWKNVYRTKSEQINIGHDVWIGNGVIILPGVTIGEFSIIGAGSVIDKTIPPYSYVTGNPMTVKKLPDVLIRKLNEQP